MPEPLLCELHAHTTWSDGSLTIPELVDLYGRTGFDVLAITDHVIRGGDPTREAASALVASSYPAYLEQVEAEAERAAARYGLVVVPGLELTFDDPDASRAAHALALGIRSFVPLDGGLDLALEEARAHGAALIAAHPYTLAGTVGAPRSTARFAQEPEWAAQALDRFEVCNRHDFFGWVAQARLPVVASGDFHRPEHLATWKTQLTAEKSETAVIDYLRSRRPVSLTRVDAPAKVRNAA